jgi:molybdopterin/thiamine biosynthesis adenylyltransferase
VVIVGVGVIGSQVAPHVGRMPEVGRVTLVDDQAYDEGNLAAQAIEPRDVGRPKAIVQAGRLRRMRRDLQTAALVVPVASVPLGRLRADVILACLDSRRARQDVNRAALRLGVPWIDAGVAGDGLLARITLFRPGNGNPCFECLLDERDYANPEQVYSCLGVRAEGAPTGAPSSLGGLAASLQSIECHKLLQGGQPLPAFDHQIHVDAAGHKVLRTRFTANPACRIVDHGVWRIEPLRCPPAGITLAAALGLAPRDGGGGGERALRVEGSPFVARLTCSRCGGERSLLRHTASLGPRSLMCGRCRGAMVASGFDMRERLEGGHLPARTLSRSLGSLGLRVGDVFSVGTSQREKHFEIAV